jgi:hypothetical protein
MKLKMGFLKYENAVVTVVAIKSKALGNINQRLDQVQIELFVAGQLLYSLYVFSREED